MKKLIINIWAILLVVLGFNSCTPEEWASPLQSEVPAAADINATITVDQSINKVTFSIANDECYPIWIFDGNEYSAQNDLTKIYSTCGTYEVEIKIANANGISDGSITKEFTIDDDIIDFDEYITKMTGNSSKEWVIASNQAGHISYGPTGTDGTETYSASPNQYVGTGLYDDIITLYSDSTYVYNPGEGGTVLVNPGCSVFSDYNTTGEDFAAPVDEQTTQLSFTVEGHDVFMTLPANTLFPYIPFDESYSSPKFKFVDLDADKMEFIVDDGTNAWHFILASKASMDEGDKGYDPDSDCNMWKTATVSNSYYYAPDWAQIADPELTQNGNSYKFSFPTATSAQWQSQCFFITDMATVSTTNYDFSCKLLSTQAIDNVTLKMYADGDNDTYFFVDNFAITAHEYTYIVHTNMEGIDISNVSLVLDIGGNPDNTEITISDIVLKENSCDDGTVIDDGSGDNNGGDVVWDVDSDCNMFNTATITNSYYYADAGWSQLANPEMTQEGTAYTLSLPTATASQWQAQFFFNTDISTNSSTTYDFHCKLYSNNDIAGVTVKLYLNGDNGTAYFEDRVDITAYENFEYEMTAMDGIDMDQVNLVVDFGGNPENTEVTVSELILKESSCND